MIACSNTQATLEEVAAADLLLHVLDVSSPNVAAQRATVYQVLRQLQIPEAKLQDSLIEVWNKSDLITDTGLPSSFAGSGSDARDSLSSIARLPADTHTLDSELGNGVSGGHVDTAEATGLRPQPGEAEGPRLGVSGMGDGADAGVDALETERAHAQRVHANTEAAAHGETESLRGVQHPLTIEEQRNSAWNLIQVGTLHPRLDPLANRKTSVCKYLIAEEEAAIMSFLFCLLTSFLSLCFACFVALIYLLGCYAGNQEAARRLAATGNCNIGHDKRGPTKPASGD